MKDQIQIFFIILNIIFNCTISAQPCASHQIRIRILQINEFDVQYPEIVADQQNMNIEGYQSELDISCTVGNSNKNIIASIASINENESVTLKINGVPIEIHNYCIEITPDKLEKQGHFHLNYISSNVKDNDTTLLFTMMDK